MTDKHLPPLWFSKSPSTMNNINFIWYPLHHFVISLDILLLTVHYEWGWLVYTIGKQISNRKGHKMPWHYLVLTNSNVARILGLWDVTGPGICEKDTVFRYLEIYKHDFHIPYYGDRVTTCPTSARVCYIKIMSRVL